MTFWQVSKSRFYIRITPKEVARHTAKCVFSARGHRCAKDGEFSRIFEHYREALDYARYLLKEQLNSARAGLEMAIENMDTFEAVEKSR